MRTSAGEEVAGNEKGKWRRTGGRSARVRQKVLGAAIEVVLEGGLEGFGIPEVAQRAGVHKSSIYRRWGNASNLLLDALLSHIGEEVPIPDTGSLRGDLTELLRRVAEFLESPTGRALVRTTSSGADSARASMGRMRYWESRFSLNRVIFERAIERGELPDGVDPELALEALVGPLYLRTLVTGEPLRQSFLDGMVGIVLDGISSKKV